MFQGEECKEREAITALLLLFETGFYIVHAVLELTEDALTLLSRSAFDSEKSTIVLWFDSLFFSSLYQHHHLVGIKLLVWKIHLSLA